MATLILCKIVEEKKGVTVLALALYKIKHEFSVHLAKTSNKTRCTRARSDVFSNK